MKRVKTLRQKQIEMRKRLEAQRKAAKAPSLRKVEKKLDEIVIYLRSQKAAHE